MSILEKLASALGRRDEAPNVALATALAASGDTAAIEELVEGLSARDKNIQSDCIKVLYEIGERKAGLIAPFKKTFAGLLGSRNNRLAWGAMTALDAIAGVDPQGIHPYLPAIVDAADTGSVITRDHAVGILIKLYAVDVYADDCFALLSEQLSKCPVNQLPMYAEMALPAIRPQHKAQFAATLQSRLGEIDKTSKRTRVEKVIRKI